MYACSVEPTYLQPDQPTFVPRRPWKMYPLGVVFGLGFDTSSEIALLGLSSVQASRGTSIWLILCFPVLFTVGMCAVDTLDGAVMMVLYTWCDDEEDDEDGEEVKEVTRRDDERDIGITGDAGPNGTIIEEQDDVQKGKTNKTVPAIGNYEETTLPTLDMAAPSTCTPLPTKRHGNSTLHNPLIFLYYSTLLTALTVLVALIIGLIQLFSLLQNVIKPEPEGRFWDGVTALGDHYDIVGGVIAGGFVLVGVGGVLGWPRFKRWIGEKRRRYEARGRGISLDTDEDEEDDNGVRGLTV